MTGYYIRNALIVNEGAQYNGSLLIRNGRIDKIYRGEKTMSVPDKTVTIDAGGNILIPGIIDDHVHFREPGLTHKGDIRSESFAAIAGGITSFMDMPNTKPQTTTQALLEEKFTLAGKVSRANYSFYLGATNDNLKEILLTDPEKVCGVKVFIGSSTGNMLVDDPLALEGIFSQSPVLLAVHCEDESTIRHNTSLFRGKYGEDIPVVFHPEIRSPEACYKASSLAVKMAKKHNTRLHILHLSTSEELQLLDTISPRHKKRITAEACIHHLFFNDDDYNTLGNLIKVNPAVKNEENRIALIEAVNKGSIDNIATDHAPHTFEEKKNSYFKTPSGGPMVQHSLVAMLELYHQGIITLEAVIDRMCHAPADIFGIENRGYIREGYYADLVLVDLNNPWIVNKDNILYKCRWSPLEGRTFHAKVTHTFINGNLVFENNRFIDAPPGMRLRFNR
ncbi:MAG: dihydroorotase [Bacteroidales bacterium]|nr:dihydroorotase [Bacteroidales bacterium]MBN2763616.1 dihydroorotase [Bacteroidales bacterium]